MKTPVLHLVFWLVYLIQDTLLHFTWMASTLITVPESEQWRMAVKTALAVLPPKLLVVYYFTQHGVDKILNAKNKWVRIIPELMGVLALSVIIFRMTFHYYINPKIYLLSLKVPLFNARSVLISILEMGYITGIAITFKLLRLQTAARERERNLVKEKLETELKFLRNQTNPHFLFNTLNNIYGLARKKSDATADVVMKLSNLLRFMLYESNNGSITIAEEIKLLENYIELQRIRYNHRLSIRFRKEIDNESQLIVPLLLLPLAENAFKHGISESRFDSFVDIDMKTKEGQLSFIMENSKEDSVVQPVCDNIGLSNIRRQLELLYKEYEMQIKNQQTTFTVILNINLNSYGKI